MSAISRKAKLIVAVIIPLIITVFVLSFLDYSDDTPHFRSQEIGDDVEVDQDPKATTVAEPQQKVQIQESGSDQSENNPTSSPADNSQSAQRVDADGRRILTKAEYDDLIANDEEFAMSVIIQQMEKNPQAKRYMQGFAAAMVPFEFYGMVVDEQGEPVPDVSVSYRLGYPYGYGYSDEKTVYSDSSGRFSIRGEAHSFAFTDIKIAYFSLSAKEQKNLMFNGIGGRGYLSWADYTVDNPYRIVLKPSPFAPPR